MPATQGIGALKAFRVLAGLAIGSSTPSLQGLRAVRLQFARLQHDDEGQATPDLHAYDLASLLSYSPTHRDTRAS